MHSKLLVADGGALEQPLFDCRVPGSGEERREPVEAGEPWKK